MPCPCRPFEKGVAEGALRANRGGSQESGGILRRGALPSPGDALTQYPRGRAGGPVKTIFQYGQAFQAGQLLPPTQDPNATARL